MSNFQSTMAICHMLESSARTAWSVEYWLRHSDQTTGMKKYEKKYIEEQIAEAKGHMDSLMATFQKMVK